MKIRKPEYAFRVNYTAWRKLRKVKKLEHLHSASETILYLVKQYESTSR